LSASYSDRAWQLYQLDRYSDALIESEKALREDPEDPDLYVLRCHCFEHLGKKKEARKSIEKAISCDPEYARSRATSAWLNLHNGRVKEALTEALIAVQLEPEDPHPHYYAALAFSSLGKHKEAKEAIDYAIYLEPLSSTYFASKAEIYNLGRDKRTALQAAEEALRLDPENADAFATRARLLRTTKHHDEAVGAARESLRLDPSDSSNRESFIETKRTRFFLYRWLLAFNEWVAGMPPHYRWVPTITILLLPRVARHFAKGTPYGLAVMLLALVCLVFIGMWYFGEFLLDAFLALDPVDKFAFSRQERRGILAVASTLIAGVVILITSIWFPKISVAGGLELMMGFFIGALLYKVESLSWKGNLMFGWAMFVHALCLVLTIAFALEVPAA
jgi:tetratricopeptide (TPR) repeat protein